jgi:hypothetical protein
MSSVIILLGNFTFFQGSPSTFIFHSTISKTSSSTAKTSCQPLFETQVHLKGHLKGVSLSKEKHCSIIRRIVRFNTHLLAYESDLIHLQWVYPGLAIQGPRGLHPSAEWRHRGSKFLNQTNTRRRSSQRIRVAVGTSCFEGFMGTRD